MRIATIQCEDNGIFFRWLQKIDKMFEPGGELSIISVFKLLLGITSRGGTDVTLALLQVTIVTSEPSLLKAKRFLACH